MTPSTHPSPPGVAFRVGVVGHRWDVLDPATEGPISRALGAVLGGIAELVGRVAADAARHGYRSGPPRLDLVTALAEGADRVAAEAALAHGGYQLNVILPFDETEYRRDFVEAAGAPGARGPYRSPEQSDAHFLQLRERASGRVLVMDGLARDQSGQRPFDAYMAGGRAVLEQCDLLLAVWNGERGRGVGGTAWVVAEARRQGVPIVRVSPPEAAEGPAPAWLDDPLCDDEGRTAGLAGLAGRVEALLLPPGNGSGNRGLKPDLRMEYFRETSRPGRWTRTFARMAQSYRRGRLRALIPPLTPLELLWHLWRGRSDPALPADYGEAGRRALAGAGAASGSESADSEAEVAARYGSPFGWADHLAIYYAGRYRSSYAFIFSLAWVAVLVAVLGAGFDLAGLEPAVWVAAVVEVGVLLSVLGLARRGRSARLHERWLDYRLLAERVRHLAALRLVCRASPGLRVPAGVLPGDPRRSWVAWLARALEREAGLCPGTMDPRHLARARQLVGALLVRSQRAYSRSTVALLEGVAGPLHRWADACFVAALGLALLHLPPVHHAIAALVPAMPVRTDAGDLTGWALLAAAVVLPAWAGALHGFAGQADLEGSTLRAAGLADSLGEIERRLDVDRAEDSGALGDLALSAVRVLEGDLVMWRTTFEGKPLREA